MTLKKVQTVDWDPKQKTIIECDEDFPTLIDAGPGSGKTAVACARVAYLVENKSLEPSKIILVSFTRTAVKELQDRIESFATNPVNLAGLNILTLDSFTWQILRGISGDEKNKLLESYEENLEKFLDLLDKNDHDLIEYLSEIQHVVIDEAQDLVGLRAELCLKLIRKLSNACGVTVFADSAQAIYGFTSDEDDGSGTGQQTLAEQILDQFPGQFITESLDEIHRTDDPNLMKLCRDGRKLLLNTRECSSDDWNLMKNFIESCAHGKTPVIQEQKLSGRNDVLVLYRTRAEVLMASSYLWDAEIQHKLRMSGISSRIHPWVARIFSTYKQAHIDFETFKTLWENYCSGESSPNSRDQFWELLIRYAGSPGNRVDMARLRSVLARERPPVEFLMDEKALPGPILGTIHASKGREADEVHLMLPNDSRINRETDERRIAEERRVLFVGASRARKKLLTGKAANLAARRISTSDRAYRVLWGKWGVQTEIGRPRDVDESSVASAGLVQSSYADSLQTWLWEHRIDNIKLCSIYSDRNRLLTESESPRFVGALSQYFASDLWTLAEKCAKANHRGSLMPRPEIRNIMMVGARTCVIPEGQRQGLHSPYRESGFLLVPVISAFTVVYFKGRTGS